MFHMPTWQLQLRKLCMNAFMLLLTFGVTHISAARHYYFQLHNFVMQLLFVM